MNKPATKKTAPRRRWRQDPQGRRSRILEAASREFAANGYRRARVEDIARSAGLSEGTVYHQFGSKQGLLIAVGENYGKGLAEAAFANVGREIHPRDVGVIVRNIFGYVRETSGPLVAFLLAKDPDEGWRARDASRAQMVRAIERTLGESRRRGLIPEMDVRIAAELQFSMVEGALQDCFLRGDGENEEAYIGETTRSLAAILGQTAPPELADR